MNLDHLEELKVLKKNYVISDDPIVGGEYEFFVQYKSKYSDDIQEKTPGNVYIDTINEPVNIYFPKDDFVFDDSCYASVGTGYCADKQELPDGSAKLDKDHTLYSPDAIEECLLRCKHHFDTDFFTVDADDNSCTCSAGTCDSLETSASNEISYKLSECTGTPKFRVQFELGERARYVGLIFTAVNAGDDVGSPHRMVINGRFYSKNMHLFVNNYNHLNSYYNHDNIVSYRSGGSATKTLKLNVRYDITVEYYDIYSNQPKAFDVAKNIMINDRTAPSCFNTNFDRDDLINSCGSCQETGVSWGKHDMTNCEHVSNEAVSMRIPGMPNAVLGMIEGVGNRFIVSTSDGHIYYSDDRGKTFTDSNTDLTGDTHNQGSIFYRLSNDILLYTVPGKIYYSKSGTEWNVATSPLNNDDQVYSFIELEDKTVIAVGKNSNAGDIWISKDFGKTWQVRNIGNNLNRVDAIKLLVTGDIIIAAGNRQIFKSTDNGINFKQISANNAMGNGIIHSLLTMVDEDDESLDSGIMIAATSDTVNPDSGDVYRTVDGGKTWTKVLDTVAWRMKSLTNLDGTILVSSGGDAGDGKVYKSTDKGATWEKIKFITDVHAISNTVRLSDGTIIAGGQYQNRALILDITDLYTSYKAYFQNPTQSVNACKAACQANENCCVFAYSNGCCRLRENDCYYREGAGSHANMCTANNGGHISNLSAMTSGAANCESWCLNRPSNPCNTNCSGSNKPDVDYSSYCYVSGDRLICPIRLYRDVSCGSVKVSFAHENGYTYTVYLSICRRGYYRVSFNIWNPGNCGCRWVTGVWRGGRRYYYGIPRGWIGVRFYWGSGRYFRSRRVYISRGWTRTIQPPTISYPRPDSDVDKPIIPFEWDNPTDVDSVTIYIDVIEGDDSNCPYVYHLRRRYWGRGRRKFHISRPWRYGNRYRITCRYCRYGRCGYRRVNFRYKYIGGRYYPRGWRRISGPGISCPRYVRTFNVPITYVLKYPAVRCELVIHVISGPDQGGPYYIDLGDYYPPGTYYEPGTHTIDIPIRFTYLTKYKIVFRYRGRDCVCGGQSTFEITYEYPYHCVEGDSPCLDFLEDDSGTQPALDTVAKRSDGFFEMSTIYQSGDYIYYLGYNNKQIARISVYDTLSADNLEVIDLSTHSILGSITYNHDIDVYNGYVYCSGFNDKDNGGSKYVWRISINDWSLDSIDYWDTGITSGFSRIRIDIYGYAFLSGAYVNGNAVGNTIIVLDLNNWKTSNIQTIVLDSGIGIGDIIVGTNYIYVADINIVTHPVIYRVPLNDDDYSLNIVKLDLVSLGALGYAYSIAISDTHLFICSSVGGNMIRISLENFVSTSASVVNGALKNTDYTGLRKCIFANGHLYSIVLNQGTPLIGTISGDSFVSSKFSIFDLSTDYPGATLSLRAIHYYLLNNAGHLCINIGNNIIDFSTNPEVPKLDDSTSFFGSDKNVTDVSKEFEYGNNVDFMGAKSLIYGDYIYLYKYKLARIHKDAEFISSNFEVIEMKHTYIHAVAEAREIKWCDIYDNDMYCTFMNDPAVIILILCLELLLMIGIVIEYH